MYIYIYMRSEVSLRLLTWLSSSNSQISRDAAAAAAAAARPQQVAYCLFKSMCLMCP